MIHSNFTPDGRKTPAFPGGIESNQAFVGVAEWAYGVADWFEQGLYLPLYSYSQNDGMTFNGFKIRELFVKPHADEQTFFYGVNFEFSVNQKQRDPRHYTSEVRPIIGWHLKPSDDSKWKPVDIIVNPIVDTSYTGGLKGLDFAPSIRVAWRREAQARTLSTLAGSERYDTDRGEDNAGLADTSCRTSHRSPVQRRPHVRQDHRWSVGQFVDEGIQTGRSVNVYLGRVTAEKVRQRSRS